MKKLLSMLLICLVASCAVFAASFEVEKSAQPAMVEKAAVTTLKSEFVLQSNKQVLSAQHLQADLILRTNEPVTQSDTQSPVALAHRAVIPDVGDVAYTFAILEDRLTVPITVRNAAVEKPKSAGFSGLAMNRFARGNI